MTPVPRHRRARKTDVLSPWTVKLVPVSENRSWFYTVHSCGSRAAYNWLIDDTTLAPLMRDATWTINLSYTTPGPSYRGSAETWWMYHFYTTADLVRHLMNVCHEFNHRAQAWDIARIYYCNYPSVRGIPDKYRMENDRVVIATINRNYVHRGRYATV